MRTYRGYRRRRSFAAARWFVALLTVSLVAMLIPPHMTAHLSNLLQVLVPFQDAVSRSADGLAGLAGGEQDAGTADATEIAVLRSTVESLAARNRELAEEFKVVTRVRDRGLDQRGRIIPARVVADDVLGWRESRLILGGTRQGIAARDGVLSFRSRLVDVSADEGAEVGMGVLASEVLVGIIEHAGTHTSRFKLLSDPDTRMPVTIGRVEGESFTSVGAEFWLVGLGRGRMEVREVDHRYVEEGSIRVGDVVLTRDDDPKLPPSVSIGTINELTRHPDNSLLYNLQINWSVDPTRLRRVYVVDLGQ